MPLNHILIKEKFDYTKKYLVILRKIITNPVDTFIDNLELQLEGERIFEILAQIMLDICTHIVANADIETPKSYSDCMSALNSLTIIPKEETEKYISLIKMRNLIVHQYGVIDYEILYQSLVTLERDFTNFRRHILIWFEKKQ